MNLVKHNVTIKTAIRTQNLYQPISFADRNKFSSRGKGSFIPLTTGNLADEPSGGLDEPPD